MYIHVIPFSHSLSITPFTYSVPPIWETSIVLGGLIEIPFGKTMDQGIIVNIFGEDIGKGDTDTIKSIEGVTASVSLLAPYQIQCIFLISQRYLIPIHRVLKMFLPTPLMKRLEKKNYILKSSEDSIVRDRQYSIIHAKNHVFSKKSLLPYCIPGNVLIFPDDYFLYTFLDTMPEGMRYSASESSPVQKSKFWIDAYEGNIPILVGTRRLLYYNLSYYTHIYYVEDAFGDEEYQYPSRIRNLDTLRCIANQQQIDITIVTSTPTLELFAKFRDFRIDSSFV